MIKRILKMLCYSFLFATLISMSIAWLNYEQTEGFEKKEAVFIIVMITFILCLMNLALSLSALLNLIPSIRKNVWISGLTFFGFPFALLIFIIQTFVNGKNPNEGYKDVLIICSPSVFYLFALSYYFFEYLKTNRINESQLSN